ncbi:hypothetical protein GMRT_10920 [Giardia muris]|uniref:Uncharacterized protein n=1 Tax=Giardia muris TaxID=5742 RepID=A0A4Z1TD48_GIAMU|nr:hypothetical protein GMRT_10920 [Giardia muris]|eukprot:TNJ30459.1 hypothetical protein GMRT_10920 [Giardia muris]
MVIASLMSSLLVCALGTDKKMTIELHNRGSILLSSNMTIKFVADDYPFVYNTYLALKIDSSIPNVSVVANGYSLLKINESDITSVTLSMSGLESLTPDLTFDIILASSGSVRVWMGLYEELGTRQILNSTSLMTSEQSRYYVLPSNHYYDCVLQFVAESMDYTVRLSGIPNDLTPNVLDLPQVLVFRPLDNSYQAYWSHDRGNNGFEYPMHIETNYYYLEILARSLLPSDTPPDSLATLSVDLSTEYLRRHVMDELVLYASDSDANYTFNITSFRNNKLIIDMLCNGTAADGQVAACFKTSPLESNCRINIVGYDQEYGWDDLQGSDIGNLGFLTIRRPTPSNIQCTFVVADFGEISDVTAATTYKIGPQRNHLFRLTYSAFQNDDILVLLRPINPTTNTPVLAANIYVSSLTIYPTSSNYELFFTINLDLPPLPAHAHFDEQAALLYIPQDSLKHHDRNIYLRIESNIHSTVTFITQSGIQILVPNVCYGPNYQNFANNNELNLNNVYYASPITDLSLFYGDAHVYVSICNMSIFSFETISDPSSHGTKQVPRPIQLIFGNTLTENGAIDVAWRELLDPINATALVSLPVHYAFLIALSSVNVVEQSSYLIKYTQGMHRVPLDRELRLVSGTSKDYAIQFTVLQEPMRYYIILISGTVNKIPVIPLSPCSFARNQPSLTFLGNVSVPDNAPGSTYPKDRLYKLDFMDFDEDPPYYLVLIAVPQSITEANLFLEAEEIVMYDPLIVNSSLKSLKVSPLKFTIKDTTSYTRTCIAIWAIMGIVVIAFCAILIVYFRIRRQDRAKDSTGDSQEVPLIIVDQMDTSTNTPTTADMWNMSIRDVMSQSFGNVVQGSSIRSPIQPSECPTLSDATVQQRQIPDINSINSRDPY